jgi:hypothetical protein
MNKYHSRANLQEPVLRHLLLLLVTSLLVACATIDFQPFEAKINVFDGTGGTKVVVDGVDFWANGTPPRKYKLLGIVSSEVGAGAGAESVIRTAVSVEVRKQGGNAAIEVGNNQAFAGVIRTAPGIYMAANRKQMRFAVIQYVD